MCEFSGWCCYFFILICWRVYWYVLDNTLVSFFAFSFSFIFFFPLFLIRMQTYFCWCYQWFKHQFISRTSLKLLIPQFLVCGETRFMISDLVHFVNPFWITFSDVTEYVPNKNKFFCALQGTPKLFKTKSTFSTRSLWQTWEIFFWSLGFGERSVT